MTTPPLSYFDDVHTHGSTGPRVLTSITPDEQLRGDYGQAWYSVGIHPWHTTDEIPAEAWEKLEKLALDPRVAAIGEAGLDALRGGEPAVQEDIFLRQAALAESVGKPLIIHCVRRYGRLMELHRSFAPRQLWMVHGFTGKPQLARQLLAEGIEISFGERANPASVAVVPEASRHFETDMSSLPIEEIRKKLKV